MIPIVGGALAVIAVAITAIYLYAVRNFGYWRQRNITYIKPIAFAGNLKDVVLFRKNIGSVLQDDYNRFKGHRYIGMYFFDQPVLFVRDISIWKNLMHRDFRHFSDRAFYSRKSDAMLYYALFALKGKIWKDLRTKLTSVFTSGKLKRHFPLLEERALHLDNYFNDAVRDDKARNVSDVCARYTADVVASVGFGIATSALTDENDHLIRVLKDCFSYSKTKLLMVLAVFVKMDLLKILSPVVTSSAFVSHIRKVAWSVIEDRERSGTSGKRGDFLDVLMELRKKGKIATNDTRMNNALFNDESQKSTDNGVLKGNNSSPNTADGCENVNSGHEPLVSSGMSSNRVELDDDAVTSQALNFFSGAFDTSSNTMSFALYELARNQQIQETLRTNLRTALDEHGGVLTYDALQNCLYLNMVLSETLRMYPPLPFLDRVCTETYRIPETDVVIEKGTVVISSILGIQRDPDYFNEPDRFDPERFSEENKMLITPGSYFPFGDGPRICLGKRLGMLQIKLCIAHIILNYRLHPCTETPQTMEFNLHSFLLQPRDGVPIKFTRV